MSFLCFFKHLYKKLIELLKLNNEMGRKKINVNDKNITYGISLHPDIVKLLKEQSKKENITISKLIQNVMNEHFKKENKIE